MNACIINLPAGAGYLYETTDYWKEFKSLTTDVVEMVNNRLKLYSTQN